MGSVSKVEEYNGCSILKSNKVVKTKNNKSKKKNKQTKNRHDINTVYFSKVNVINEMYFLDG
jgi:hypothetical protein